MVSDLGGAWGPTSDQDAAGRRPAGARRGLHAGDAAARRRSPLTRAAQRLLDEMVAALRRGPVEWMPGAQRLLAEVADAGVPRALVSSSRRPVVDAVLDAIGREHLPGDRVRRRRRRTPSRIPTRTCWPPGSLGVDAGPVRRARGLDTGATSARRRRLRHDPGAAGAATCRPRRWRGWPRPVLRPR